MQTVNDVKRHIVLDNESAKLSSQIERLKVTILFTAVQKISQN
jgi:predicted lipase